MAKNEGNTQGSDGRHDKAVIKHGIMAARGQRSGDAEAARIGGRVVRHLTAKGNKDHPPTGGKGKG